MCRVRGRPRASSSSLPRDRSARGHDGYGGCCRFRPLRKGPNCGRGEVPSVAGQGCRKTREGGTMPQFAVITYSDDAANEPDKIDDTAAEIAGCDDHAYEMASQAMMTGDWAFTQRAMRRDEQTSEIT